MTGLSLVPNLIYLVGSHGISFVWIEGPLLALQNLVLRLNRHLEELQRWHIVRNRIRSPGAF